MDANQNNNTIKKFVITRLWTPPVQLIDQTNPPPQPQQIKLYVGQENGKIDSVEDIARAWKFDTEEDAKDCLGWLTRGWTIEMIEEIEEIEEVVENGSIENTNNESEPNAAKG